MVEIMPCLLVGKHFWIALVLATLLLIVIAPLRIRRSAPHRFAPTPAASLPDARGGTAGAVALSESAQKCWRWPAGNPADGDDDVSAMMMFITGDYHCL